MKHQKIGNKKQVFHSFFPIYIYICTHQGSGFFPHPLTTTSSALTKNIYISVECPQGGELERVSTQLDSVGVFEKRRLSKIGAKRWLFRPPKSRWNGPGIAIHVWPLIRGFQEHIVVHLLRCMLKKGYEIWDKLPIGCKLLWINRTTPATECQIMDREKILNFISECLNLGIIHS